MSEVSMPSLNSWFEIFQVLRAEAEAHRGAITVSSPDAEDAFTFPRTTGQDVLAISVPFDSAVRASVPLTVLQRWLAENDLIATQSPWTLADPYVGNRSYWSTLALVVIELDRAHAPLPALETWEGVLAQLAAPPGPLRHAAGAMLITLFTAPTWAEMVHRQLDLFRVLRGEDVTSDPRMPIAPIVPRTCNADVLELARYWTEQLTRIGVHARETHARMLYARWPEVVENVSRYAKRGNPRAPYLLNLEFWTALVMLAQCDAAELVPAPWAFQPPPIGRGPLRRNAGAEGTDHIVFPEAKTWDDAARMQKTEFSKLRGEDVYPVTAGQAGAHVTHIPRTTISDVRQVADYWALAIARAGVDKSDHSKIKLWDDALAQVMRIPSDADPNSVYQFNREFWTAVMNISVQVAVHDEAPSRFTLALESLGQGFKKLPDTLSTVWDAVQDAGKKVIANAIGHPLLYAAGGVVVGGALIYLLLRNRN